MSRAKIAITLDQELLITLDALVKNNIFSNRSAAINEALSDKLEKIQKSRLEKECLKLNQTDEKAFAELGLSEDIESWPKY